MNNFNNIYKVLCTEIMKWQSDASLNLLYITKNGGEERKVEQNELETRIKYCFPEKIWSSLSLEATGKYTQEGNLCIIYLPQNSRNLIERFVFI